MYLGAQEAFSDWFDHFHRGQPRNQFLYQQHVDFLVFFNNGVTVKKPLTKLLTSIYCTQLPLESKYLGKNAFSFKENIFIYFFLFLFIFLFSELINVPVTPGSESKWGQNSGSGSNGSDSAGAKNLMSPDGNAQFQLKPIIQF